MSVSLSFQISLREQNVYKAIILSLKEQLQSLRGENAALKVCKLTF